MRKGKIIHTKIKNQIKFIKSLIEKKLLGNKKWINWDLYKGYKFDSTIKQPEFRPFKDHYKILLPAESKNDFAKILYEISHEFIHLIFPIPQNEVLYIEEGLATKFQLDFIRSRKLKDSSKLPYHEEMIKKIEIEFPEYYQAYQDILHLEEATSKSIYDICKHLISNNLIESFAEVTPELLSNEYHLKDNEEVLQRLGSKFY